MSNVIQARNLTKRYRDLLAVSSIDFDIRQGECFGFLGPNGAGKTTTIRMITCTSPVTDGDLLVDGKDVRSNQKAIKSVLGVVSQADSLDPGLNVIQNLLSYGRYFNLPSTVASQRAVEALDFFHLKDKANQSVDELSGGMRRRLLIARALLNEPRVLVLDEPTTGLDPQSRLLVWEKITDLKGRGITILLTTHYMEEASYLCDRLLVLDAGRILVEGSPDDLVKDHIGSLVTEIKVSQKEKGRIMATLTDLGIGLDDRGDSIVVYQKDGLGGLNDLGLDENQLTSRPANLEDVFLRLTGRGLREE